MPAAMRDRQFDEIPAADVKVQIAAQTVHEPPANFHGAGVIQKILVQDKYLARRLGGFEAVGAQIADGWNTHGWHLGGWHARQNNNREPFP